VKVATGEREEGRIMGEPYKFKAFAIKTNVSAVPESVGRGDE
jgi:hypothetical protein